MGEGLSSAKEDIKEDDTMSMASRMSRMSFKPIRHNVDQSMSLDRKVIGYKTRTISELTNEDELKIRLEGYNRYELTADIDSGCSVCFGKRSLFPDVM